MNISRIRQKPDELLRLAESLAQLSSKDIAIYKANRQLEYNFVTKETEAFSKSLTPRHCLYAVTLTPSKDDLISQRLTSNKSDCSAYIQELVDQLLHLFHKDCHNNYARYESKLTQFFAPVEFTNKHHSKSVTPHTHVCFAIHPEYQDVFDRLLIDHPKPNERTPAENQKTIDFRKFTNQMKAIPLEAKIKSIHITKLNRDDFQTYASYCYKEQTHELKLPQNTETRAMIEKILKDEITRERNLILMISQLDLDAQSKEEIRARTYDKYSEIQFINELEKA
jgi:hypothetical protein